MELLKVGHVTKEDLGTGVTVFLFDKPVVGAYQRMGASPASHELTTLDLDTSVTGVDALVFAGGSAFGLSATDGVVRWLKKQGRGFVTHAGNVPIVPAAAIYDLAVKSDRPPTSEDGFLASEMAVANNFLQGPIGAGTGASVGKLIDSAIPMRGGVGCAQMTLENGISVLAYAVVNCVGDVYSKNGNIIAGAQLANGHFADCTTSILKGRDDSRASLFNTTLVAVFTNAGFDKNTLKRIAMVGVSGMARAISPVFTRYDGDILFCFSLGEKKASEQVVGVMAAEVVRLAIVNSVENSFPIISG